MEIIIPKESLLYNGFYCIPNNEYVVVSPEGIFKNTHTGNLVKVGTDLAGYSKIFVRDSTNKYHGYIAHRLLALTFIGRPSRHLDKDYDELEVNHKDGIKENNALTNLEWVTPKENIHHALSTGLMSGKRVLAKHILSGEVLHFNNITECSKLFNLNIMRLSRHLRSAKNGTLTKNWYVFKYEDDYLWPELVGTKLQQNTWDTVYGMWYAKNINDGVVLYNDTLSNLCSFVNLKYDTIRDKVSTNGKEVTFNSWVIWYDDTPLVSAIRTLAARKLPEGIRPAIKIRCTNVVTGEINILDSMNKAAIYLNTVASTIKRAIVNKDGMCKDFKLEYV